MHQGGDPVVTAGGNVQRGQGACRLQWIDGPVVTAMGDARKAIIANTAEAFVAVAGGHGTLSEIAFALKRSKRVVGLGTWDVDPAVVTASAPADAVRLVLESP